MLQALTAILLCQLAGEAISAPRALELGLINHVVPDGGLEDGGTLVYLVGNNFLDTP